MSDRNAQTCRWPRLRLRKQKASFTRKPILKSSAEGHPVTAPKGSRSLFSTTYIDTSAKLSISASLQNMATQMSESTEGGDTEVNSMPLPGVVNVEEHDEPVEDVYDWVSTKVCRIHAMLKSDKPVSYYEKYLVPPKGQKWRLMPVPGVPVCSEHKHIGFFFYGAALEAMNVSASTELIPTISLEVSTNSSVAIIAELLGIP